MILIDQALWDEGTSRALLPPAPTVDADEDLIASVDEFLRDTAGKRAFVPSLALAGIAAGVDGLMIEVHLNPDMAMSDGAQSLDFTEFANLMPKMSAVVEAIGRTLPVQVGVGVKG